MNLLLNSLSFAKRYWKGVTIFLLLIVCSILTDAYDEKSKSLKEVYKASNLFKAGLIESEKQYNTEVKKVQALDISYQTLKKLHEDEKFKWLQKHENLKADYRNLESAYQIALKVKENIEQVQISDTIIYIQSDTGEVKREAQTFYYADAYSSISGLIEEKLVNIDYTVDVPLEVVAYWERSWILGRKRWAVEVVSANENVRTYGVNSVVIKKR
ncbi:hypothetical protein [Flammeovirga sp. SJP92]|uniref:hypothetical protein n=1 Tax=Flammeovirga sp. SJP92 TaxID=1775430 RepID=UPI000786D95E|nr:hypothetical protein [Flammeovirga sp. SJP92]KXX70772.1 hypothetical protein AVL50_07130 [Flammeovirga sp. SJP92]